MPTQRPKVRISFHAEEVEAAEVARLPKSATHLAPGGQRLLAALGLMLLAIFSALPAVNGGFLLNDDVTVSANPALRSWRGLVPIWLTPQRMPQVQPFTHTALLVEHAFFRDSPFGYHVINLLLHAGVTLLLWTLLRKLELRGAWLAAALWAVHPVTVASVAWISQQKVLWASVWYLAALIVYFRYSGLNPQPPEDPEMASYYQFGLPRTRRLLYAIAMLLLVLSLFSQAALAVTFVPVVMIAIWWERARVTRRDLMPLIAPAILSTAVGAAVLYVEIYHAGARGGDFPTLMQRPILMGRAIWFDLLSVVVPLRLAFAYAQWNLSAANPLNWLPLLCAIAVLASLWNLRRRIGRSPFASAAIYVALLLPVLGIVNFNWMRQSYVGDHLQYLACAAPITAIVCALASFVAARTDQIAPRAIGGAVASIVVVVLLVRSLVRATDYNDQNRLWTRTLDVNPGSIAAHNSLGRLALAKKDYTTAERHFRAALEVDPENVEAHRNLGEAYRVPGQWDRAVGQYYQVLRRRPDDVDARFMLAGALAEEGDIDGAMREYQEVIRLRPNYALAYLNLGQLYANARGELSEAVKYYREAVRVNPRLVEAQVNLAIVLFQLGNIDEAIEHNNVAREIDPRNFEAYLNGTAMLEEIAKHAATPAEKYTIYLRALDWSHAAIAIREDSALAFCNRGYLLAKLSPFEPKQRAMQLLSEAVACFRRAQALHPDAKTLQRAEEGERMAERERTFRESRPDDSPLVPMNSPATTRPAS